MWQNPKPEPHATVMAGHLWPTGREATVAIEEKV